MLLHLYAMAAPNTFVESGQGCCVLHAVDHDLILFHLAEQTYYL
jgi:hypothetical protein